MPTTETKAAKQLSDGNSVGTVLGQSASDNIGFYGLATPVPQILQGSLAGLNGVIRVYTTTQTPIAVGSFLTTETPMTVTGAGATDMVIAVVKPTAQAGVMVGTGRMSAASTAQITFGNDTNTAISPTAGESYFIVTGASQLQYPSVTLTPASVAANSVVEQQFTVTGVQVGMSVAVNKPTLQAGLMISGARAVATNVVGVSFVNVTAATITPTAGEAYLFFAAQGLRVQPVMQNITATLTPTSVAANTTAEQTFTVTGLVSGTAVFVDKPSVTAGLAVTGARVSAANTLALTFANVTGTAITPPSEVYTIGVFTALAPALSTVPVTQYASHGMDAGRALSYMGLVSGDTVAP